VYRAIPTKPRRRRVVSERSGPRGPRGMTRGRTASAAGRRSRRTLLFYVLVATVSAQLAALYMDKGALLAFFTVAGLLLSALAIHAEG
jgi:hypothetical protein